MNSKVISCGHCHADVESKMAQACPQCLDPLCADCNELILQKIQEQGMECQ